MAKNNNSGVEVKVDDQIVISCRGIKRSGKVISADHWDKDGWYIEFIGPDGYGYWKQGPDGGKLIEVNGVKVNE